MATASVLKTGWGSNTVPWEFDPLRLRMSIEIRATKVLHCDWVEAGGDRCPVILDLGFGPTSGWEKMLGDLVPTARLRGWHVELHTQVYEGIRVEAQCPWHVAKVEQPSPTPNAYASLYAAVHGLKEQLDRDVDGYTMIGNLAARVVACSHRDAVAKLLRDHDAACTK